MRFLAASTVLAGMASMASATGILLPLYVYPTEANWKPVYDSIAAYKKIPWTIVINPGNGPGATRQPGNGDANYITGTSKLNSYSNVETVGYVRTNWAATPIETVKADLDVWASWSSYKSADLEMRGIFFDEAGSDYNYLQQATAYARQVLGRDTTIVCNFGTKFDAKFYNICDIGVVFESCLNCGDGVPFNGQTTVDEYVPKNYAADSAIIVRGFSGVGIDSQAADVNLLKSHIKTIVNNKVGQLYFCSAGYDDITTAPASLTQVAQSLASYV